MRLTLKKITRLGTQNFGFSEKQDAHFVFGTSNVTFQKHKRINLKTEATPFQKHKRITRKLNPIYGIKTNLIS